MAYTDDAIRDLTRRVFGLWQDNTTDLAPDVMRQSVDAYLDQPRFEYEVERIFKHLPLALAISSELPVPDTYKAMDVMGVPLLLTRNADGAARAFLNVCRHRGSPLCEPGSGSAQRLTCPYHAWSYDTAGDLVGMFGAHTFGDVDRDHLALTPLACAEKAGFVFACLTPGVTFDIDTFLGDFAPYVAALELDQWHIFEQRILDGPGWKVAWDGYLEGYHQERLHPKTVGLNTIGNLMAHDTWGPHQRIVFGRKSLPKLVDQPEEEWDLDEHIRLIHSIFPNVSISGILGDYCLLSQLFPGPTVDTSLTIQTVLCRHEPTTEEEQKVAEQFSALVLQAVRDEDYWVGFQIQNALKSGATSEVLFGRNEPSLQHYHHAVERYAELSVDRET
ncbi:MAG: aromatic ring-hydroxylating dioxygenase subunit alpha [Acidimicrobiia bacterium]|nr:aromatic ring-hydroxylating dioxygenase subunit alpha [Acidimicrobiia bacterium]MYB75271.1 aromatic ring-hydroxylating dioxygenase subunit alpha [Acidimicrobiia bacterium]MYH97831.1 aromatic ring-hydroxylating dioxygenase subunit alpha [Acidimicrobiia bacterium]